MAQERKNKVVAGVLALFLGWLGVHKFYLNRPGAGLIFFLFAWTGIPLIIAFFEGLSYLMSSQDSFDAKYNTWVLAEKFAAAQGAARVAQLDAEPKVRCGDCAELILAAAKKCKHCGAVVATAEAQSPTKTA